MPLRAIVNGRELIGPLTDDSEWERARRTARQDAAAVAMVCCGAPGRPRTSKLGLRHFAHRPGADCVLAAGETIHHLNLKAQLLAAITELGWEAKCEVPEGNWRADVLGIAGAERVAFEVQWS